MKALLLKHLKSHDSWTGLTLLGFGLLLQSGIVGPLVAVTWLAWAIGALRLLRSHNS